MSCRREGTLTHSAYLGGCVAGWLYAHLLGFGRASFVQRALHQRKASVERYRQMDAEQFIAEEVDPLLEKISREGLQSLSRSERRTLAIAREKLGEQTLSLRRSARRPLAVSTGWRAALAVPRWTTTGPGSKRKPRRALIPARSSGRSPRWPKIGPSEEDDLRSVVEQFPLGEAALLHLISVSSIGAARLARDPHILLWLRHPEVSADRARAESDAGRSAPRGANASVERGKFSRAPAVERARDVAHRAARSRGGRLRSRRRPRSLSQLAEICVAEVLAHWDAELRGRLGAPDAEFAVLALGKLGGRELNHSSDIDVIFFYSEEGQVTPSLSYHEWFSRLATKVFETFASKDPNGALFRMDLRLRPEGSAGPIVRSLASLENYYAGFGETWERLALIKARGIGGQPRNWPTIFCANISRSFIRRRPRRNCSTRSPRSNAGSNATSSATKIWIGT